MQIDPSEFYNQLLKHGINFFSGVPDSLLKDFCFFVDDKLSEEKHIIAANEGSAISIGAGYHLATNKIPLVYMQNSGIGNAVNPLLSLCDPDVYSIPMLLMIGWRGEPGHKDEPQHVKQGRVQLDMLDAMEIPYEIVSNESSSYEKSLSDLIKIARNKSRPVALIVKKKTFKEYIKKSTVKNSSKISRENALELILNNLRKDDIIISTTGKTSREIFEIRKKHKMTHMQDFLTVGSMGHCSSIALGISMSKNNRRIICIDGDGSMLMHMGNMATISSIQPKNYKYILLNNEVHESVGGQSTAAKNNDLSKIAAAFDFKTVLRARDKNDIEKSLQKAINSNKLSFIEVLIKPGSRADLGRPTISPVKNKNSFMNFLKDN